MKDYLCSMYCTKFGLWSGTNLASLVSPHPPGYLYAEYLADATTWISVTVEENDAMGF